MSATVRLSTGALAGLAEMDAWWRKNRLDAPDLLLEELHATERLLSEQPEIGELAPRPNAENLRRVLMERTRNWVYYLYAPEEDDVLIVSVWGAPKRGLPEL